MIIMHMLMFRANYILSTLSFLCWHNSDPCSHIQSLINCMPLEMKCFSRTLSNHTYFKVKSEPMDTIIHNNEGQGKYLGEFRAPRDPSYPPQSIQLKLHHQIQQDCKIHHLPSYHGIGSRRNSGNIVVCDSQSSWIVGSLFWTPRAWVCDCQLQVQRMNGFTPVQQRILFLTLIELAPWRWHKAMHCKVRRTTDRVDAQVKLEIYPAVACNH